MQRAKVARGRNEQADRLLSLTVELAVEAKGEGAQVGPLGEGEAAVSVGSIEPLYGVRVDIIPRDEKGTHTTS